MGSKILSFLIGSGLMLSACSNSELIRHQECLQVAKRLNLVAKLSEVCALESQEFQTTWFVDYSELAGFNRGLDVVTALERAPRVAKCRKKNKCNSMHANGFMTREHFECLARCEE